MVVLIFRYFNLFAGTIFDEVNQLCNWPENVYPPCGTKVDDGNWGGNSNGNWNGNNGGWANGQNGG